MIKVITNEYREGDSAVITKTIALFGVTIYSSRKTTTNNEIVNLLTVQEKRTVIKGFKNED